MLIMPLHVWVISGPHLVAMLLLVFQNNGAETLLFLQHCGSSCVRGSVLLRQGHCHTHPAPSSEPTICQSSAQRL